MKTRKPRSIKRADAKNSLPIGINYSAMYYQSGKIIPRGRVSASFGRKNVKSFSINKFGHDQAIKLAIDWREQQLSNRG